MALGKRKIEQSELFIAATDLAHGPGHPFYTKLNEVLGTAGFDEFAEQLCAPYYADGGRPSIPPGVYFRMLLIGYFEGLDSQRGIAWRCADSLALRAFLGVGPTKATPVHASMTIIRQRLAETVFDKVFRFVLGLLEQQGLLRGKTLAIDATTLEANAAMKSIVRTDTAEDWQQYLRRLAQAEGIEEPTEEDLRRLDRGRKDKKVPNQQWQSPTDPDSRIAKMKDGRTHLAYKAEHAVDLDSEAIVAPLITHADRADADSAPLTLTLAQANLVLASPQADHAPTVQEAVLDKGYHDNGLLAECARRGVRTYIPERRQKSRCWTNKPTEYETAFRANRRRVRSAKGRRLNRWRSERAERSFAHVCETGGGRRSWLRGLVNVSKTYTLKCAAYNLGLLLRKVWGLSKPRTLLDYVRALWALVIQWCDRQWLLVAPAIPPSSFPTAYHLRPLARASLVESDVL
jgi:transposase